MPSRPGAYSTAWWASNSRRYSGKRSSRRFRPAGCRAWPSASSWNANGRSWPSAAPPTTASPHGSTARTTPPRPSSRRSSTGVSIRPRRRKDSCRRAATPISAYSTAKANPPNGIPPDRSPPPRSSRRRAANSACRFRRRCRSHSASTKTVTSPTCVPTPRTSPRKPSLPPVRRSSRCSARSTATSANTRPRAKGHRRPTKPFAPPTSTASRSKVRRRRNGSTT